MLPDNTFLHKTVVITGGATGLGLAMGLALRGLGANIVIASRKQANLEKAALQLDPTGEAVLTVVADVRLPEDTENIYKQALAKFGKVDALINNAAGNFISPTEMLSHKAFDTVVDIVLKGTYNMTLTFGKHWLAAGQKAAILNIVTTYATSGSGFVVPSATAKAGVIALTKSLAAEWGHRGIRSVAVAPGQFPTEGAWKRLFPAHLLPPQVAEKFEAERSIPAGRVGQPEELANLICYLLSDYAAFINGDVITIDGAESLLGAGQFSWLRDVPPAMWASIAAATGKK